jgi:hypothetical protein
MNSAEETREIFSHSVMPKRDEKWFILENHRREPIKNLEDTSQAIYIAQKMSEKAFVAGNHRYAVISAMGFYNRFRSDRKFRYAVSNGDRVITRELILNSGLVIPDPEVRDINGELKYIQETQAIVDKGKLKTIKATKSTELEIKPGDNVTKTLVRAGVYHVEDVTKIDSTKHHLPTVKLDSLPIQFDEGAASVFFKKWTDDSFTLGACSTSLGDFMTVFEKLPVKKPNKM